MTMSTDHNSTTGSQVTLTSYMIGAEDVDNKTKFEGAILDLPDDRCRHHDDDFVQLSPSVTQWFRERLRKTCSRKILQKRIPVTEWLPSYGISYAFCDLVAGITVGLTVIPQGIAYANVAGLPPQIGLYSSFMACFVYTIFGSCKETAIGPTAIAALLTRESSHNMGVPGAILLCFLSGCVQLLMGIFQLGFLIDFISGPVSVGFTSAAAIIIATTQIKDILGLTYPGGKFLLVWSQIFEHFWETRLWDLVLGISCMALLLILRSMKNLKIGPEDLKERRQVHEILTKCLWFISITRNIIIVCFSALLAYLCEYQHGSSPFILTGYIKPGLPSLTPPPFTTKVDNTTYDFIDMSSTLGSGILVVPLLALLESIALAKVFSDGKAIDATQEMVALGVCNIASSFVQAMPVAGAFSRGAVNHASGVKTTFGGVYTGIIVLVSIQLFTPYFSYIPKASLAAVIIAAVVFMVEFNVVKPIWKSKKSDLIPAFTTFVCCLFLRLEVGVAVGIGVNLLFLLYATARPSVAVEKSKTLNGVEYLLITPDRSLTFPSVEYVRGLVSKAGVKQGCSSTPVVIDARHIQGADFTAARGVKSLIEDFQKRRQPILFYNLKPSVISTFEGVRPKDFVYCNSPSALNDFLKQFTENK